MKKIFLFFSLAILLCARPAHTQPVYVADAHTEVELVSDVSSIVPGQTFRVAVRMKMDDHWHVYWINAGDSGLPPQVSWYAKINTVIPGNMYWPFPKRIDYGGLAGYIYEGELFLVNDFEASPDLEIGSTQTINANVEFLACEKVCVPGKATVSLDLLVAQQSESNPQWQKAFEETKKTWALPSSDWTISVVDEGKTLRFKIIPPAENPYALSEVYFFAYRNDVIDHVVDQPFHAVDDGYELIVTKSPFLEGPFYHVGGILVSKEGWLGPGTQRSLDVDIQLVEPSDEEEIVAAPPSSDIPAPQIKSEIEFESTGSQLTVVLACLFAFIGGLILNLMPCVLPVLSIKVLSLIKHSEDKHKAWKNGLVFALGVIVSFWVLAGVLIALRLSGEYIGWGFQFQSPGFVVFMTALLFLLALNLFGVFEIGTSLTKLGAAGSKSSGYQASFMSGVLTTVVATPCTAPFMGTALGFALAQPVYISFLIFTCLALGLAFPYVVLSRFPQLLSKVPKAGRWMIGFKTALGFLMMATVVWLLWVLGSQSGVNAMTAMAVGLLFIGFGAWILGFSQNKFNRCIACAFIIGGFAFGFIGIGQNEAILNPTSVHSTQIQWQEYSPELVEKLRKEGKTVFINFTAKWCISCQVNEAIVFKDERVIRKFNDKAIVPIKADWTNYDETITRALAAFGKSSIPLYVIYTNDASKPPIIFPEIITPNIVLDTLNQLD